MAMEKMRKFLSDLPTILKLAYGDWKEDNAARLSAALAYHTIFSLAPLLLIVIAITGLIWQKDLVRTQILSQVQDLTGPKGADFIASLIANTGSPAKSMVALIIGTITLVFGALGVFNELHNSLNIIWEVEVAQPERYLQGIKKLLVDRFLSFAMILVIGFLLLVSLVVTAGVSATQKTIGYALPFSEFMLQLMNLVISIGVITVLFALIFKFLPDAQIAWQDVWIGAFVTSLLFSLGKAVIGIYLGNSAVTSSFGAAGSLVLLLLWIYYSAQILFFGAEFTQAYANKYGSKITLEGEKKSAQSKAKESKSPGRRPFLAPTAVIAISNGGGQLEKQNRQTGRVLLGMMIVSFLTGLFTAMIGLKKR